MLSFALGPPPFAQPGGDIARLIGYIGEGGFADEVLRQFGKPVEASHCSILGFDPGSQSCMIDAASTEGEGALAAGSAYVSQGFFSHDRAFTDPRLASVDGLVHVLSRTDVLSAEHRRLCFDEFGIVERCSVVARLSNGRAVSANFYRCATAGAFSDDDHHFVCQQAPLLLATLAKHYQLRAVQRAATPAADPLAVLSNREREVVERCVRGKSAKDIARDLDIATTTVNTLKQRAYQRLGVRRQSELIALVSGTRHYT